MATDPQIQAAKVTSPPALAKSVRLRVFVILLASFWGMITAFAVGAGFMIHSWEDGLRAEIERNLTQKAHMFANEVNSDRTRGIGTLTSQTGQLAGARATVIDMNGKVIADSEVRIADLDNEGRQPEFVAALRRDTGAEVRSRGEFGMPVLYIAVPVAGGAVRLACPLADVAIASSRANRILALAAGAAVVAALIISAVAAVAVAPLNQAR
jgi:two-component system, OmpR family, phosphate regulon sensor histidine kinase PhoR